MKAKFEPQNTNANLKDYAAARQSFSWEKEKKSFSWHKTGDCNIAFEAVDRWVQDPYRSAGTALIFEKGGRTQTFTYQELSQESCRVSNLLKAHGLKAGDRFFIFAPPCPEIHLAMVACARLGIVFCPMYSTLSYSELLACLKDGEPRALLTHPDLAERLPPEAMDGLDALFLTEGPKTGLLENEVLLPQELGGMDPVCAPVWLDPEAPLYLMYTSGVAGPPNGVVHAHRDMVGMRATGRDVLDLSGDTVLWTDCDPAWVTGTIYSAFAPWLCGAASVVQGDPFSASTVYRTLERHKVEVLYTTPQRITGLAEAGDDLPGRYDLSCLRHIATAGRALSPQLFFWVRKNLGLAPHENWWMTETGMICLANFLSMAIKPGSMGKPVPGVEAAILDDDGEQLPILTLGELALKAGWPAMMTGIWNNPGKMKKYLRHEGWFLTGDMAIKDEEGYLFHQGRNDDLVKAGDKFIGPFEVEQTLCRHPAVSEAAVIAKTPQGEEPYVKAFVSVHRGLEPSTRLALELKEFVRANLSPAGPRVEVAFLSELPKTRSGKILRRVLRARELGLPAGEYFKTPD